ncbi:MAG: hypothetical protein V1725_06450 [archaeon]
MTTLVMELAKSAKTATTVGIGCFGAGLACGLAGYDAVNDPLIPIMAASVGLEATVCAVQRAVDFGGAGSAFVGAEAGLGFGAVCSSAGYILGTGIRYFTN